MMKAYYQMKKEDVLRNLGASECGWTSAEAEQRLVQTGPNALAEGEQKSVFKIFVEQFADLLVWILMIAAGISLFSGDVESAIVIFAVLILNAVLGTVQSVKAEKSLKALKSLSSPHAHVLRDGKKCAILSTQVVPGDVLLLEVGDMVSADARILCNHSLQVNESALTGESTNVDKQDIEMTEETPLADRVNMVYSGTLVTYGRAEALVTATAMNTEMGKIAGLMNQTKSVKTPLQRSMDDFSRKLAVLIMVICLLVFGMQWYQGNGLLPSLLFAVALAVAAIPEALSSIVTIVQAMGTQKMAVQGAIIKKLSAVESLGCVSVICSDKTGTLTQNKMTVTKLYLDKHCVDPQELTGDSLVQKAFLYNAVLNNDAVLTEGKQLGDPTESCLLVLAQNLTDTKQLRNTMQRLEEIPFDSDRKLMSTKYLGIEEEQSDVVYTKGAVDVLLERTTHILTSKGMQPITEEDKRMILRQNQQFSEQGLRVLAFGQRSVAKDQHLTLDQERNLTFIGLAAMIDPPRIESGKAVEDAKRAGIRTVMITGDHKVTATAIAKQLGIFGEGDIAVTGQELDAMSEEEHLQQLEKIAVYARVSPENKIRIVDAWQQKGKITAMTGDGVNDAPALKKADIGVAMGITGTEVSKDAAAMILTDDNFATIIKAVCNGRNVYRNIKNAIQFLLSGNMAGILAVLYCCVAGLPAPFAAVHLLFINLLTDSLPALAIGMESVDERLLQDTPRDPSEKLLNSSFIRNMLIYGSMIAAVTITAFYLGDPVHTVQTAMTMAFATLTLARLFHGFNLRSKYSLVRIGLCSNRWSIVAFGVGVLLLVLVLCIPAARSAFAASSLTGAQTVSVAVLAGLPTIIIQGFRILRERLSGTDR